MQSRPVHAPGMLSLILGGHKPTAGSLYCQQLSLTALQKYHVSCTLPCWRNVQPKRQAGHGQCHLQLLLPGWSENAALEMLCQGLSQLLKPRAHHREQPFIPAVKGCTECTHSNQEHFEEPSVMAWREKGALLINLRLNTATILHFAWTILIFFSHLVV